MAVRRYVTIYGAAILCLTAMLGGCGLCARQISADQRNQAWHASYQEGWEAIRRDDYPQAEQSLLIALRQAESFDHADRRLAETCDDLGLVYYQLGDDFKAEQMQGRAVTELLLAKGPNESDLSIFVARLGYIYARQGRATAIGLLKEHPYRVLDMTYVCHDETLAQRVDGLIFEYKRATNLEAVDYLGKLVTQIRTCSFRGNFR